MHVSEHAEVPEPACTVITFGYWFYNTESDASMQTKATATILVSKNSGRYRVQSTCLPALWLVLDELTDRIKSYWLQKGTVKISYNEHLPLSDFYAAIDRHHNSRRTVRFAEAALNDGAHQFRIIQKRLLVRFKDSRPAVLDKLDVLLWQTHRNLLHLARSVELAQKKRGRSGHILACGTQLLLLLMRIRFDLSSVKFTVLCSYLSPAVTELNHAAVEESLSGWEETTDSALTYLLKTMLSKQRSTDELNSLLPGVAKFNVPPIPLAFPLATDKLKRHVAMVCDRLERGLTLVIDYSRDHSRDQPSNCLP